MLSLGGLISSLKSPGEHLGAGVTPAPWSKLAECCERVSGEPTLQSSCTSFPFCAFSQDLLWPQHSTECSLVFYHCVLVSFLTDELAAIFPG